MQQRRTHSEERRFPPDARSVREARHFVQGVLSDDEDLAANAALVVSELAGNAVVHTTSSFTVRIAVGRAVVRGEVADGDRHLPVVGSIAARAFAGPGGRGLVIVDAVSARWGARPDGHGGKVVWFELDVPRRVPGAGNSGLRNSGMG